MHDDFKVHMEFRFIADAAGLKLSDFRITATLVMMISSILCVLRGCCLPGAPKNRILTSTYERENTPGSRSFYVLSPPGGRNMVILKGHKVA